MAGATGSDGTESKKFAGATGSGEDATSSMAKKVAVIAESTEKTAEAEEKDVIAAVDAEAGAVNAKGTPGALSRLQKLKRSELTSKPKCQLSNLKLRR